MAASQSNIGNDEQSFQSNAPNEPPLEGIKSELHTIVDKLQRDESPSEQKPRPLLQRFFIGALIACLVTFVVVLFYNPRTDNCSGAKVQYRGKILCIASERDFLVMNETYETEILARDTSEPLPIDSLSEAKFNALRDDINAKYEDKSAADYETRARLTHLNALRGNDIDSASYCRNWAMGYYNVAVDYLNKGHRDSACLAYQFLKDWHWKDSVLTKMELAVLEQACAYRPKEFLPSPKKKAEKPQKPQTQPKLLPQTPPQYKKPILPTAQLPDFKIDNLPTKRLETVENTVRNAPTGTDNNPKSPQSPQRITPVEYITTKVGNTAFEMVKVAGGTFKMGSDDKEAEKDEQPVHSVTVSDFYIGKYEVTQKQWRDVMGTDPSYNKKCDDCPVENVSWNDIQEFLKKLNSQSKTQFRLPTEAEWEFAARGGNVSVGYKYSGSDNIDQVAWYYPNSKNKTQAVGTKKANELGIYDMSGNIWEWCSDWYDENYYKNSRAQNPKGASKGTYRSLRGGSWYSIDYSVSNRVRSYPNNRNSDYGFRVSYDK